MLEKFITHSPSEFSYLRRNSPMNDVVEAMKRPESYRYSKVRLFTVIVMLVLTPAVGCFRDAITAGCSRLAPSGQRRL